MVKSLTDSLVSREEEERHQKNLNENDSLSKGSGFYAWVEVKFYTSNPVLIFMGLNRI